MDFYPINKMIDRINVDKDDSSASYFNSLMYTGEFMIKIITLSLVSTITDSIDNHKYRFYYELVRADGIGSWARIIDDVITGPAAQYVLYEAVEERIQLTEKKQNSWQYSAVSKLHQCLKVIEPNIEDLPVKVDLRKWFDLFVRLRNKSRAHGATTGAQHNAIVEKLHESIETILNNYNVFKRPWAYLYKNNSGKYRVSKMNPAAEQLNYLKSNNNVNVTNGIYIAFEHQLCFVDLFQTDVDLSDFFIANGGFTNSKFEMLSYITSKFITGDSKQYHKPASELPRSETRGLKDLDVLGEVFTNMPKQTTAYINRNELEQEMLKILRDDRHPIVTLSGRGGIGKTSLALHVLEKVSYEGVFKLVVWLSARDIDLLEIGPKQVKPDVVSLKEIVREYWKHVNSIVLKESESRQIELFTKELEYSQEDGPTLFVFDNFETVSNPAEMFSFISTYIRLPNKVVITTRNREFKADYPIEVSGMNKIECDKLAKTTASRLAINDQIDDNFLEVLYNDSEGHPYIVKIIMGEKAKRKAVKSVDQIIGNREDILEALFERTFILLSEGAKRVFFTLCNWRSVIPQLAVEAVLQRNMVSSNRFNVKEAIDELEKSSFIDVFSSENDSTLFISVPLAASIFGKRKLSISTMKNLIEADTEFLHLFGALQKHEIKRGIEPRITKLFKEIERSLTLKKSALADHTNILEFVARNYTDAWIFMANLHETFDGKTDDVKLFLYNYLEEEQYNESKKMAVWTRIAEIEEKEENYKDYINALIEKSFLAVSDFESISDAAYRVNYMLANKAEELNYHPEEKHMLLQKLAEKMEDRIEEGNATDCSRLCWLFLNLEEQEKAVIHLQRGLSLEPNNDHCLKLKSRLKV